MQSGANSSPCCFCINLRLGVFAIGMIQMIESTQQIFYGVIFSASYIKENSTSSPDLIATLYIHVIFEILQLLSTVLSLYTISTQQRKNWRNLLTWIVAIHVNCLYQVIILIYVLITVNDNNIRLITSIMAVILIPKNILFTYNIYKYYKQAVQGHCDKRFRYKPNQNLSCRENNSSVRRNNGLAPKVMKKPSLSAISESGYEVSYLSESGFDRAYTSDLEFVKTYHSDSTLESLHGLIKV